MAHQWTRKTTDNNTVASDQNQHLEQEQLNSPAQELAERVYSWSTAELDYRPDRGDIQARNHQRIALYASTSRSKQPEYSPQALISLCHGPCGPMFEYLAENLKSRSTIAEQNRDNADQTLERKQYSLVARQKQESRSLQCYEVTLAIARKQREIAEAKERIKKQRQLQTVKEIHHQQETQTIRTKDGVSQFLEIIAGSKSAQLQALESIKDQKLVESEAGSQATGSNEAARLLHMFRGHHVERVVQVESTLNKVAACEREKAQLYSEMRFRAQRRDQEKKPNHFSQDLEETKAFLNGLRTALEFIQTEQENLVERVMAADELREKIETIGRASRVAEQKLHQAQHSSRKVTEMVELNLQKVPSLANSIAGEITESLSQGLAQLSTYVQARNTTGVNDIKILQDLTEKGQVAYEASHAHLTPLPGPSRPGSSLTSLPLLGGAGMEAGHVHAWYATSGSSSLSAEQLILQKARLQNHSLVRQLSVSKAKDLNTRLARSNTETTASMNDVMLQLLGSSSLGTDVPASHRGGSISRTQQRVTGALSVDSLGSKLKGDIKEIVGSLIRYDDEYQTALATEIEQVVNAAESANDVVESVRWLVEDGHRIASRLQTTQDQGHGRSKTGRDSIATTAAAATEHKRMRFIH
ncbi:hypothetical protein BGX24_008087 [Mortierella sp. AD032]|nr:hypothetical protein BGX24_008087 [Mortierella sp. AD032]